MPGVPDFYQGNEIWDFSLVDPDNRREIDYARRQAIARRGPTQAPAASLLENWRDGGIKLRLTQGLLQFRAPASAAVLARILPAVTGAGAFGDQVVAFTRRREGASILVVVPRLTAKLGSPPLGLMWDDTRLAAGPTRGRLARRVHRAVPSRPANRFSCERFSPNCPSPCCKAPMHRSPAPIMKIEDYGIIGDMHTMALVGLNGSIDWLCVPRFGSDACFAALLGEENNGCWKICPAEESVTRTRRCYRGDTLILETEFTTETGVVRVIDFMPVSGPNRDVIRIVEGVAGEVAMQMRLVIRFDYGRTVPWVRHLDDGGVIAVAGPNALTLRTPMCRSGARISPPWPNSR